MTLPSDLIDHVSSVEAGSLRRPVAKQQAQQSFAALFQPVDDTHFPVDERWAVAAFATQLTNDDETAAFYAAEAATRTTVADKVVQLARESAESGPYGVYPEIGLQSENVDGERPTFEDAGISARLAAALRHAHLVTYRPREASGRDHEALIYAGWTPDGIVTLSQLIAFLAFQQRVAAGLRVLSQEVSA